jgi:putative phage-type endonuclease
VYPDREAWLAGRGLGASDSAGILGVGYAGQSPVTIFAEKAHGVQTEWSADELERLEVGKIMEPTLRKLFTHKTGIGCRELPEFCIHRHPEFPFITASLDALTDDDEPLELKNVSWFAGSDWIDEEPPLKYAIQVQHQLAVTGAQGGWLFGLIGGSKPVAKRIERNDKFIAALIDQLRKFWSHVESKTLPPIDESEATARVLSRLWPEDSGATVALPKDAARWATERETCKAVIKEAEALKTHAENQIKASIGDATFGDLPPLDEVEAVADVKTRLLAMVEKANVVVPPRYSWKTQVAQIKAVEAHTRTSRVLRNAK